MRTKSQEDKPEEEGRERTMIVLAWSKVPAFHPHPNASGRYTRT